MQPQDTPAGRRIPSSPACRQDVGHRPQPPCPRPCDLVTVGPHPEYHAALPDGTHPFPKALLSPLDCHTGAVSKTGRHRARSPSPGWIPLPVLTPSSVSNPVHASPSPSQGRLLIFCLPGVRHSQAPSCSFSPTSWVPTIPEMLCLCTESCLPQAQDPALPSFSSWASPCYPSPWANAAQPAGLQVEPLTWLWIWALDSCSGASRAPCSRSPFMPAGPGATGLETVAGTPVSCIPRHLAATPLLCWPTPRGLSAYVLFLSFPRGATPPRWPGPLLDVSARGCPNS